jgi:hypothetical protein
MGYRRKLASSMTAVLEADKLIWEENGLIMYSLPEEEMQKITPYWNRWKNKWLSEMEEKGIPARKYMLR